MSPTSVSETHIKRARMLRREMTSGERRLWAELKQFRRLYGVHVRRQVPIGAYVADFAVHSHRLVIEIDGEFHQLKDRKLADQHRDGWLAGVGYRVLRLNSGELESNFDGCVDAILREVGKI